MGHGQVRGLDPFEVRRGLPFEPVAVSEGWPMGLVAERYSAIEANELHLPAESYFRVSLQLAHTPGSWHRWQFGKALGEGLWQRPHFTLSPTTEDQDWVWDGVVGSFHLCLRPDLLQEVAGEMGYPDKVSLSPVADSKDDDAERLLRVLEDELRHGEAFNPAKVEYTSRALMCHLIDAYAPRQSRTLPPPAQSLTQGMRRAVEAVVRDRLGENLKVGGLAQACKCSKRHLERAFPKSFGVTPAAYIRHRRLDTALRLLRGSKMNKGEIAIRCGFADESHLRKVIHRHTGKTPTTIRHELQAK